MNEPKMNGNVLHLPVKFLLKKFKKDSGYKEAKKHNPEDLSDFYGFDSDTFICSTIDKISDDLTGGSYDYPEPVHVHGAFREVAPFMFKADRAGEEFIFNWLKRPYQEVLGEESSFGTSNTENRIRILKLILLVNPSAVLRIKMQKG